MGGASSAEGSSKLPSTRQSTSSSWGQTAAPQTGYPAYPHQQYYSPPQSQTAAPHENQTAAPQTGYPAYPQQQYYSPPQSYERWPHEPQRKLDRRHSRIAENYNSLEEVTEALARAGLESSNLIIGIDFTKSNEWTGARSFNRRSLHHIADDLNPYEQAISIIGKTLAAFDDDNLIPCFGFGDASTHDQHVFSFYPGERLCNGFGEVLSRHRELVPHLRLAGPTSFAPIIEMAMTIVEQSGGQYHVLLIIADGQVTRSVDTGCGQLSPQERKTVEAIVEASKFPLSIILVGVGDGPWDQMKEFDENIPARAFDNFQFVNFTEIMSKNVPQSRKETEFALAALMGIPSQYKATIELNMLGSRKGNAPERVSLPPPIYGAAPTSNSTPSQPTSIQQNSSSYYGHGSPIGMASHATSSTSDNQKFENIGLRSNDDKNLNGNKYDHGGHDGRRFRHFRDCPYYLRGTCKFGLNCKFYHPVSMADQVGKEKEKDKEKDKAKEGLSEKYEHKIECKKVGKEKEKDKEKDKAKEGLSEKYEQKIECKVGKEKEKDKEKDKTKEGLSEKYEQKIECKVGKDKEKDKEKDKAKEGLSEKYGQKIECKKVGKEKEKDKEKDKAKEGLSEKYEQKIECKKVSKEEEAEAKAKAKVNEGLREKPDQIEYKYSPTGGCKYGKSYRYNHLKDEPEIAPLELNFLGLPIRLGKKKCPFYMKNGSCGFGAHCKFHHPDPTAVGGDDPHNSTPNGESDGQFGWPSGNYNSESIPLHVSGASPPAQASWSSQMLSDIAVPYQDNHSSYMPTKYFDPQGALQTPEWSGHQAPNLPEERSRHPHSAPAAKSLTKKVDISSQFEEYPERPGQPECDYFRKTGDCKVKSARRDHHPNNRAPTANCVLSDKGLPLRPGQKICRNYEKSGNCRYGRACLFDHPVNRNSTFPVGSVLESTLR